MAEQEIEKRIMAFANELRELVRKEALAAVRSALGEAPAAARPAAVQTASPPRRRGRRRRAAAKPPAAAGAASASKAKPAAAAKAPAAGKSANVGDGAIVDYVKAHPGARVEEMVRALRVPTEKLKARVSDLVAANAIKKTGKTRGTKYFPV